MPKKLNKPIEPKSILQLWDGGRGFSAEFIKLLHETGKTKESQKGKK